MNNLKIELAVPGYYKKELLGMLLLGKKAGGEHFTEEEISFFQVLVQDCSMAVKTAEYHRDLIDRMKNLKRALKKSAAFEIRSGKRFMKFSVL